MTTLSNSRLAFQKGNGRLLLILDQSEGEVTNVLGRGRQTECSKATHLDTGLSCVGIISLNHHDEISSE